MRFGVGILFVLAVSWSIVSASGPTASTASTASTYSSVEAAEQAVTAPPKTEARVRPRTRKLLHRSLRKDKRWNVVLVLTDDQPKGMLDAMPILRNRIARRGVTYSNAYIPTSVCCPSRASLLTGELAAQTGVYTNADNANIGGYRAFKRNGNEKRTLAVALKKAGYRTGYFGKYLNHYGEWYRGRKPKGWSEWSAFTTTKRSGKYYRYPVTTPYSKRDRRRIARGKRPKTPSTKRVGQYSTTYFGAQTARFIRETRKSKPILAIFAPYAPHSGYVAKSKYRNSLSDTGWWRHDPSVGEADVSDKPRWVQDRQDSSKLGSWLAKGVHTRQRETLRSVDDEIGRLVRALRKTKRLKRTVFMFVSDNGYAHGEHGLYGKYTPYRAATEVPLVVRYGNKLRSPYEDPRVAAANIDLTATILRAAGVPERVRGRPLTSPRRRGGVPLTGVAYGRKPPYCGWRTATKGYVRYGSGEEEYYDYRADPYELQNQIGNAGAAPAIRAMRRRAARACRPTPPGYGPSFSNPTWRYRKPKPSLTPSPAPTPSLTPSPAPTPSESQTPSSSPSGTPTSASPSATEELASPTVVAGG